LLEIPPLLESPSVVLDSNCLKFILLLLSPWEATPHFYENVDDRDAVKSDQGMENEDLQP